MTQIQSTAPPSGPAGTCSAAAAETRGVACFRQFVVAGSLTMSAALVMVSGLINPDDTGRSEDLYRAAVEQHTALVVAAVLLVLSSLLLVPGVLGSARLVRGRGRVAAGVAATFGVMGALGHMAYATFALILTELPGPELPRPEAVALLDRLNSAPAIGAVAVPLIAGYALCVVALPIALYRGKLIPLWAVAPAVGAVAIEAVSLGGGWAAATKYGLSLASAAVISVHLMAMRTSEWQDPPVVPTKRAVRASRSSDAHELTRSSS